jgi:copper transport protein
MNALRRLMLIAAAAVVVLVVGTSTAAAHPTLLSTTPQAGYAVPTAPSVITMVFDEPVTVDPNGVRLVDESKKAIRTSTVTREQGGRRLSLQVLDHLDPGRYIVRWEVTAQDGDVVDSGFDFAVATSSAGLQGQDQAATAALPLIVILRWLLFLALAGVIGGLAGERLARRAGPAAVEPRSLVRSAAVLGLLATAGLLAHLLATAGSGRAVYLLVVEAVGLSAVAAVARHRRLIAPLAVAVVGAEALRNHLGTRHGTVGALIIAVHLIAVGAWIGALIHLLRVAYANRGRAVRIRPMFAAYARLALALFLTAAATGIVGALLLVPNLKDLVTTDYGLVLIAKLALVAVVAGLAWTARRRLTRPTTQPVSDPSEPAPVARIGRIEATVLVTVLALTAALVSLPTPAPATQDLGYPPPVAGPVIRLGALAGQIAVGIAASQNQLEIRLRTPDDRVQTGDAEPPTFHVTAKLDTSPAQLVLRPCGPGCFISPVQWRDTTQYLDLRVDAAGWHGGTSTIPITWPPKPDRTLLPRVVAAMRAQKTIHIAETVTSDTARPTPATQQLSTDGSEFLESEPYGTNPALDTTLLPGGRTTLAFGLPAEGIHGQLEIDSSYRIVREVLTAPKHLISRTFSYPR